MEGVQQLAAVEGWEHTPLEASRWLGAVGVCHMNWDCTVH